MRRLALLAAAIVGLGFPAGLGLAVYLASGSTLDSPAVSARVPTGTIARPSVPPVTVTTNDVSGNCDEPEHRADPECLGVTTNATTTDETTTEDGTTTDELTFTFTDDDTATTDEETTTTETDDDSSGQGRGRGRNRGRGGDD